MGEGVKVLGNRGSPYSKRVEIALKLKGISYDYQEEDPYGNKSPELLKSNPVYKKIPVLIHNGKPIAESLVILEYIDEVWEGYPILPKDPYHKATARIWAKFIDDKCLPSLWNALWATNDEEQEKTLKEAKENLEILEKEIKGKKFFGGENIGFVDIVANYIGCGLVTIQENFGKNILTKESYPYLTKWMEEYVKCNIIKENSPSKDSLFALIKLRHETLENLKK
ncbi:glutathione S-transferase U8-like [Chenopodium quinoa]|uniref:glutathione S-transferase U8-like n=1 Tax=Chenopodium quinoa TaxID=63459 RepID=UPI000B771829|nr:glutathione S-transferase U8-like [Chenopodium quinoa]